MISNLKDSVAAKLSSIDLANVDNLFGAFETAARVFVQKAKVPETQVKQQLTIYAGVTDYLADTRLFGRGLIDIQPQGLRRQVNDFVYLKYQDEFDRLKNNVNWGYNTISTFDYTNGTPVIRIVSKYTPQQIILDPMSSTTGWVAEGNASGLALDSSFFYQNPGSLRVNLAFSGSQGTLTKTITSTDLTSYLGVGVVFLAVEVPTGSNFTSFGVKIGSSASNYYTVSNTVCILGSFTSGQFMLIPLDLSLATTVGTPDITKITYIQVFANYNGTAQNNVRFGSLFISLPTPVTIIYSTAAFFSVAGVLSDSITAVTDTIILNDAAYTIYEYECCIAVLEQVGGATGDSMIARIDGKLNSSYTRQGKIMVLGLYDKYISENPSEVIRNVGSYYDNASPYQS